MPEQADIFELLNLVTFYYNISFSTRNDDFVN